MDEKTGDGQVQAWSVKHLPIELSWSYAFYIKALTCYSESLWPSLT